MPLLFALNDFGRSFATRGRGSEIHEELAKRIREDDRVTIDFAGITHVSYSFADEFVGKLVASGAAVEPINMTPAVAGPVQRAISRRAGAALAC